MESKSFRGEISRGLGTGWLVYLIVSSLVIGLSGGVTLYLPSLLISLIFPSFRAVSDNLLQKGVLLLLKVQPWLDFEAREFLSAYRGLDRSRGVLLVSNHRSHLDTFLLLSQVPGIRLLAKLGLFGVPFLGLIMWTSRQIPVRRKNLKSFVEAMDRVQAALSAGDVVQVFPEMTRSSEEFLGVAPFSPAPFLAAMRAGVPILPFAVLGTGKAWPKGSSSIRGNVPVRLRPLPMISPGQAAGFAGAKDLAEFCRSQIERACLERL